MHSQTQKVAVIVTYEKRVWSPSVYGLQESSTNRITSMLKNYSALVVLFISHLAINSVLSSAQGRGF